jgi:predicted acyl esterase
VCIDDYSVSYEGSSTGIEGGVTRWHLVEHILFLPVAYPNRVSQSVHSLSYEAINHDSVTIGGAAYVCLNLAVRGGVDASIFAYLEDVNVATGAIHNITEGIVRAQHQLTNTSINCNDVPTFNDATTAFVRSYNRVNARPLVEDQLTNIVVVMEPVVYRILPGHTIRLSLTGHDTNAFEALPIDQRPSSWRVYHSSSIVLPLIN